MKINIKYLKCFFSFLMPTTVQVDGTYLVFKQSNLSLLLQTSVSSPVFASSTPLFTSPNFCFISVPSLISTQSHPTTGSLLQYTNPTRIQYYTQPSLYSVLLVSVLLIVVCQVYRLVRRRETINLRICSAIKLLEPIVEFQELFGVPGSNYYLLKVKILFRLSFFVEAVDLPEKEEERKSAVAVVELQVQLQLMYFRQSCS